MFNINFWFPHAVSTAVTKPENTTGKMCIKNLIATINYYVNHLTLNEY